MCFLSFFHTGILTKLGKCAKAETDAYEQSADNPDSELAGVQICHACTTRNPRFQQSCSMCFTPLRAAPVPSMALDERPVIDPDEDEMNLHPLVGSKNASVMKVSPIMLVFYMLVYANALLLFHLCH